MTALAATVLVASLVGSAHCAGMCGGFVCFYAGADGRAGAGAHAAYHGGRLASYLTLGVLAGLAGAGFDRAGALVGVGHAAAIVAGVMMVGWGLVTLAGAHAARLARVRVPALLAVPLRAVHDQPPAIRAAGMGLLTTLLPCGWLWAFVIAAAGTGSVAGAVTTMAAFWLGTVPALLAIGVGISRVAGPLRQRLPMVGAAVVVLMGLLSLADHLRPRGGHGMGAHAAHAAAARPASATPPAGAGPSPTGAAEDTPSAAAHGHR